MATFHWETFPIFTIFSIICPMKRNLLLLIVIIFALTSVSLTAQTVKNPFNGTNLDGWKFRGDCENCWKVGRLVADATSIDIVPIAAEGRAGIALRRTGIAPRRAADTNARLFAPALANTIDAQWQQEPRKGVDIYTEEKFGDCTVKLEFLVTRGSNSGVYLMGEYEVQINDSFAKNPGRPLSQADMGAIYSAAEPSRNAAGVPGTWQSYEIEFVAPKFDASGNKTANAVFKKVILNGVVVQENVEVKEPTGGGLTMKEAPTGPLMLQGDHGPVAFRNIEIIVP